MSANFRWLIPLLMLVFFDWYGYQVIRTVGNNTLVDGIYWTLAVASYFIAIGVLVFGIRLQNKTARMYVTAVFFMLLVFKLLLSVSAFTDDLIRLIKTMAYSVQSGEFKSSLLPRSALVCSVGLVFSSVPLLAMFYGMVRNPFRYKVVKVPLELPNLPVALAGFKIVQISDIHSGSFTGTTPLKRAVKIINDQKADVVFFTGDLVNSYSKEALPYIDVFSNIQAKHGVFSVLGNHDYGDYVQWPNQEAYRKNFEQMIDIHKQLGWNLLLNEHAVVTNNNETIAVIGVENWSASPRFKKYGNLSEAYKGTEKSSVKLLLSHDPSHWRAEVLKHYPDIVATFSGHTHAFQFGINLPFWKWSPVKWMYKEWYGLYKDRQQFLYVNPGFGFVAYPGRVGFRPEITVFELIPNNSTLRPE